MLDAGYPAGWLLLCSLTGSAPCLCMATLSLLSEVQRCRATVGERRLTLFVLFQQQARCPMLEVHTGEDSYCLPEMSVLGAPSLKAPSVISGHGQAPLKSNPEHLNKGLALACIFQLPPPFCYQKDSLSCYRRCLK